MRTLFVCSEFYAGLLPFGATIVNTMRGDDCFAIFICTPKCDYRKAVIPNGDNYVFLNFPQGRVKGLMHHIYPVVLLKSIEKVCKANQIDVIHMLTEDASLALHIGQLKKLAKVYYTVHDLFFHEQIFKNAFKWLLRKVLIQMRVRRLINKTDNLVTSSHFQYNWMLEHFPGKKIFFHDFPTLLTESIIHGDMAVPELKGVKNYILFFGQVEQYKGVEYLYNAYIKKPFKDKPLVIAGKGHIYFERDLAKEQNVIFVNRYIDDAEIKQLFINAFCVVFPYISGTQSGILSFPYYFKTPSLVSDIPFFKELIIDNVTSLSVDVRNPDLLTEKITELKAPGTTAKLIKAGEDHYQKIYDGKVLKQQLLAAFEL
ncbi:glycosyltransferase family 4 protein [Mucilaginibacter sp. FT3.2]|uniref:glycosyltransferase family 4 protein n=1 Tax=Mucilaginibacter sp. FT3.2 TaxID=2723090 RepID=UPI00160BEE7E|nr:glycosyltransferase family 4 protein [Mucilaginibacter sp. FT3.2]MBB6234173.1 glycosyltransferase involved in cell wall biosynthesis [Mucilaginibacter sp. FT3.2]